MMRLVLIHALFTFTMPLAVACGGHPVPPSSSPGSSTGTTGETAVVWDTDSDYILDDDDMCPNEPEDVDGFEDADGCPDYDVSPW